MVLGDPLAAEVLEWSQIDGTSKFGRRMYPEALYYDDKLWIISGFDGNVTGYADAWYSTDGVEWVAATRNAEFGPRFRSGSAVFDGKMWIAGGDNGSGALSDIYYSTDGIVWSLANASPGWEEMDYVRLVVYDSKLWLMGDLNREVWSSTDGTTWNLISTNAIPPGDVCSIMVYDDKIWWMNPDPYRTTEVYNTTDGITWNLVTADHGYPARSHAGCAVVNGYMWVFGGVNPGGQGLNDVWRSTDGVTWEEMTASTIWSVREQFGYTTDGSFLYVLGGFPYGQPLEDVWISGTIEAPTVTPTPIPTITIYKSQSTALVHPGDTITYWINWNIDGTAENVIVRDRYDRWQLLILAVSPAPTVTYPEVAIVYGTISDISGGITITAKVKPVSSVQPTLPNYVHLQASNLPSFPSAEVSAVVAPFVPSPTITRTQSVTLTPTRTPTCTITKTHTVSPTVTNTRTITRTATISHTPTITPTVTPTGTKTSTVTTTPTPRDTPTPNLTPHYYFSSIDVFQSPVMLSVTTTTGILVIPNNFPEYGVPIAYLRSGPLTPTAAVDVEVSTTTAYTTFTVIDYAGNTVDCSYPYAIIDYIVLRKRSNFPWW